MTGIQAKDCVVFHSFLTLRCTLYKDKESLSEWSSHGDGALYYHTCINEENYKFASIRSLFLARIQSNGQMNTLWL